MKKLALLIPMSLLALLSCSDDDNIETTSSEASIVGVWKLEKSQTLSGSDSTKIINEEIITDTCKAKSTYEFTRDNKVITKIFINYEGECIEDGSETIKYTYDKNKKTLTLSSSENIISVAELTSKSLILKTQDRDYDNDGVKDITKISYYK